jgi:hypothetical protein
MKQLIAFTLLLFFFSLFSEGQTGTIVINGQVTDQETSEGIAFVSIGIEGTSQGTATNPEGYFELKVSDELKSKNLYFSAIGFKNISRPIADFIQQPGLVILLVPQAYRIDEINVAAESLVLQRILRTASERIPRNYISGPVNLKLYVENRESIGGESGQSTRTIVNLFDDSGYAKPSWTNAFKNRNYKIAEMHLDDPQTDLSEVATHIDELLEMDIVRLSNTIMNRNLITDYKLKLEAKTRYNSDSVWIISYQALKNDLAHTGSYYPTSFTGKIYIACSDYAVLRNEIHLTESKSGSQGRSLATKISQQIQPQMNITVGYRKTDGKYVLSFINSEKQFTTPQKNRVYRSERMVTLETEKSNPEIIKGRDYFADIKPNETFWNNFLIPSN